MATSDLQLPPTGFQRMLSWQLSQVPDYTQSESVMNKKYKRRKKQKEDTDIEQHVDFSSTEKKQEYIVINSDGEEDIYYSAPETPITSEEEEEEDFGILPSPESHDSSLVELSPEKTKKRWVMHITVF